MSVVELSPVVKTVEVRRSARDAFRIFTAEVAAWWPMATISRRCSSVNLLKPRLAIALPGGVYVSM